MAISQQQGELLSLPGPQSLLAIFHHLSLDTKNGQLPCQQGTIDRMIIGHQYFATQLLCKRWEVRCDPLL